MKIYKILIFMFIFFGMFIFNFNYVSAADSKNDFLNEYGLSISFILQNSNQGTNEGNYNEGNLVSCGPNLIKDIPSMIPSTIHIIYLILQIAVPIILVILGLIDFIKAMVNSKEDEIKKGQKTFISRIIAGVLIFFVFSIVKLVISVVADDSTKVINCVECFINDNDKCIR